MTTFLLVHGTGDGGWIWQKLTPLLQAGGHTVYTPTLTGVGDRSHLLHCGVKLTTHITDITNLLFYEDLSDVVLVGHSYGGMVITGVAAKAPERLKRLVFLDAYMPAEGQSEADLWPDEMRASILADDAARQGVREPVPPDILGINDPELLAWVLARATPHPMATYTEPVPAGGSMSAALPRAYIHCTLGTTAPIFAPFSAKARAEGWRVYELATGHSPMLTMPEQVAGLLVELGAAD